MVTEIWTIEKQMADRERWAAEKASKEEREKADIRIKEEHEKADIRIKEERKKADAEKAELVEKIKHLESLITSNSNI